MILEVLRLIVVSQAMLIAVLVVGSLTHSFVTEATRRRRQPAISQATSMLARLLSGQATVEEAVVALQDLPVTVRGEVLGSLVTTVRGEQQHLLAIVAASCGVVEHAVGWTQSRRPGRRLRGTRILRRVGVAPPELTTLLEDPWPPVRAEASRLVIHRTAPRLVRQLIGRLADPDSGVRFAAKDALVRCGASVVTEVVEELGADELTTEVRAALLEVLVHVADSSHLPVARRFSSDHDPPVRRGAARLSAAVGGTAGVTVLSTLLTDPDDGVRAAAIDGFGQLGYWPAAPTIAERLSDPAWVVRKAAGGALRRMGAPGRLFLRRALDHEDPYARDMARQVLDLPELRAAG